MIWYGVVCYGACGLTSTGLPRYEVVRTCCCTYVFYVWMFVFVCVFLCLYLCVHVYVYLCTPVRVYFVYVCVLCSGKQSERASKQASEDAITQA